MPEKDVGLSEANRKFCPSGTCHQSEFDLLRSSVNGQAGKVEMLRAPRNGCDTAGSLGAGRGVRTSNLLCSRFPRRLCGRSDHLTVVRSAVSDPFQIVLGRVDVYFYPSISMQPQGRSKSFEHHVLRNVAREGKLTTLLTPPFPRRPCKGVETSSVSMLLKGSFVTVSHLSDVKTPQKKVEPSLTELFKSRYPRGRRLIRGAICCSDK